MKREMNSEIILSTLLLIAIMIQVGCYRIPFYDLVAEDISYDSSRIRFDIEHINWAVSIGNEIFYKEDSTYNSLEQYCLKFKDVPYSDSMFYLSLVNITFPNLNTNMFADSIKIYSLNTSLLADYSVLPQETEYGQFDYGNVRMMRVEPLIIPKSLKSDFVIEYKLSIFNNSSNKLISSRLIKLKAEYKKKTYSPIFPGN